MQWIDQKGQIVLINLIFRILIPYLDFRFGHRRGLGDGVGAVVREPGEYVPQ